MSTVNDSPVKKQLKTQTKEELEKLDGLLQPELPVTAEFVVALAGEVRGIVIAALHKAQHHLVHGERLRCSRAALAAIGACGRTILAWAQKFADPGLGVMGGARRVRQLDALRVVALTFARELDELPHQVPLLDHAELLRHCGTIDREVF